MMSRLSASTACKLLLRTDKLSQKYITSKFSQLACRASNSALRNKCAFNLHRHSNAIGIISVRYENTNATSTDGYIINETPEAAIKVPPTEDILSQIPAAPTPRAEEIVESVLKFHPNGDPTLTSVGLGGWTPSGIVQQSLEFLHVGCELPWWGAIAAGTLCVRLLIFPLVIIAQRNAMKMNQYLPILQKIQLKMTEARQAGNEYEAAMYSNEMVMFWKEKKINPLKNFVVVLAQAPLFISFLWALRGMANVPLESLKQGGLWWFTDLTIPDPYYVLPVVTCLTLLVTIEVGTDTAGVQSMGLIRYFLRAMPFVVFPFIMNLPGALLCYWVSTNFISLLQVGALRVPRVRTFFNIPLYVKHDTSKLPIKPKGFKEGLTDSWTNVKISKRLADRERADIKQFNEAGHGPIRKTYTYDPTKQAPPDARTILAKKR